jgi:hypothetical protein
MGMKKNEKTISKGSEQPPTKVGLDDERNKTPVEKVPTEDEGGITDKVMEDQSKYHQVQRT